MKMQLDIPGGVIACQEAEVSCRPTQGLECQEQGSERKKMVDLLLVEDNPGDVRLAKEALKDRPIQINVNVARDGVEALDYLKRQGRFSEAPRPVLILLDLNLPRMSGPEVLREIKADPDLRSIPVIVMTTSRTPQDIHRAYSLNANCYVTKPVGLDDFLAMMHSIEEFWLEKAELPTS